MPRKVLRCKPRCPNERLAMVNSDATPAQFPAAAPEGAAAIDVAHLIKLYKNTRAVDDV